MAPQVNDSLSHNRDLICSLVISFYMDLFSAGTDDVRKFFYEGLYPLSLVSQKENSSLAVLSFDEVKITIFSMDIVSSRGLECFTVYFFQEC